MKIKRDRYLNELIRKMWNDSVKIITGIRRCGKSYLLNVLFKDYLVEHGVNEDHIIMIELDTLSNRAYHNPFLLNEKIKSMMKDNDEYYLLLDEIQYVDDFEYLLNEYLYKKNVDVYVTGSNSRFLSKDIITEFRGRGDEVRMHPLSFSEFMTISDKEKHQALEEYMVFGGMPKVALMKNNTDKIKYLTNLFEETYLKDIVYRNELKEEYNLNVVIDVLCSSTGSMTNPNKIANTMRTVESSSITKKTVVKYIGCLNDAFLFEEVKRYDIRGRKYIGALYKYYSEDIGLRNARINFRQQEKTHIMENIIYNELRTRGFAVDVGIVRQRKNIEGATPVFESEVDFIANKGDRKYYIQSALSIPDSEKRKQEISPFLNINDSFKKIVIVGDDTYMNIDDNGIITMNIYDFLLDEKNMDEY